ncbi:hypothetical protein AVEN_221836-1 [Araneus ventricosus]|uniref:Uncharacterized protein n=1 Tax=Araneus ventricosus TaxID=182803 RepID=A0A4Y2FY48_ARAVE|nr:hypothetical protein AVEN_221836-1 [Araneus ventricosus]
MVPSLKGSFSLGGYGCPNLEVPMDLFSLYAYTSPTYVFCFLLSTSIPRWQAREISMGSCCRSVRFLFLMDTQKPHVLAFRGDPSDGCIHCGLQCINSAGILTIWLVC